LETVSPNRRRTLAASQAFAARFPSSEAKSEFYRQLGRKSAEGRVVLRREDVAALAQAYALLSRIAAKLPDLETEANNAST
jgi:hypothetical protein